MHTQVLYTPVIHVHCGTVALKPISWHVQNAHSGKPGPYSAFEYPCVCVCAKCAVRGPEEEPCEVGTETVFFAAQPCPQPAAACSPACLKMSLLLRKRPGFMATLLSAWTCQLGRASPNSPLHSVTVITPLGIHSKSLAILRHVHLL